MKHIFTELQTNTVTCVHVLSSLKPIFQLALKEASTRRKILGLRLLKPLEAEVITILHDLGEIRPRHKVEFSLQIIFCMFFEFDNLFFLFWSRKKRLPSGKRENKIIKWKKTGFLEIGKQ